MQFVECPNDINGMIDAAKFADLALLLIDGSYGFEMVSVLNKSIIFCLEMHSFRMQQQRVLDITCMLTSSPRNGKSG